MTDQNDTHTAVIEMAGHGPQMLHVPVLSIAASLTNPRKHMDQAKLQELADSIAATGVHQPILLRPLPAHRLEDTHQAARAQKRPAPEYELIAGERRWRACQLAGVADIPAMIRPMTDAQALEAQVIENLQREDVTELEEAEGYQVLMEHQGITAEEVGRKIGKSRAYVYSRLKILDLCEDGRQALREGKLDFSCALPIARIPNEQLQLQALKEALREGYYGNRPSAREVQTLVRRHYMTNLADAKFSPSDETLLPAAGACSTCPHRTGNSPDLFDDIGADVCTNPPCYQSKEEAHTVRLRKDALDSGCEVIDGREAKELIPSQYISEVRGYLRLDNVGDSPVKGKTLRKLVGDVMETAGIKPTMVVNPHNEELIAVLRPEQAQELLAMAGKAEASEELAREAAMEGKRAAREAKEKEDEAYEQGWRTDVLARIAAALQTPSTAMVQTAAYMTAEHVVGTLNGDSAKQLAKMLDLPTAGVKPKEALLELIKTSDHPILLAGLVLAQRDSSYSPWYYRMNPNEERNPRLMDMAEACGVDVAAVQAATKANMRADKAEKKAAHTTKSAAPKEDLPQSPAARATRGGSVGKAKGRGKKSPAAPAGDGEERLSPAEATAGIAAALQAAEGETGSGAAEAAQSDEPGPVAADAAQAQGVAITYKKHRTALPSADKPDADAQAVESCSSANTHPLASMLGRRVKVLASAKGRTQEPHIGKRGQIVAIIGPEAVDVDVKLKGAESVRVGYHVSELEMLEEKEQ